MTSRTIRGARMTCAGTPRPRQRRLAALLASMLLLALASGCGGDDGATVRVIGTEGASSSGSASASAPAAGSASASGPASVGDPGGDGGYAYATDVSAHRLVSADVCAIKDLLDAGALDLDAIATIYREGGASVNDDGSVRTLAGFAGATDRLHAVDDLFGPAALDAAMTAALERRGPLADAADAVVAQVVEKTAQNRILVAWTIHELNTALAKAADGDLDPIDGAVHNWDEAWAFYHGAEPGCAPYATADSRADNFGTADDAGTAAANAAILEAMIDGRDALLEGDVDAARAAADEVVRNIVITYSQATIRYATLAADDVGAGDDAAAAAHQAEGLTFWQVLAPIVATAGADLQAVEGILALDVAPGSGGDGDDVRAALAPAWATLEIAEDEIGTLR